MVSLQQIWEQLLTIVEQEVGSRIVDTWLRSLLFEQWDSFNQVVYLAAPNGFVRDWVAGNYTVLLQENLGRLLNVALVKVVIFEKNNGQPTGSSGRIQHIVSARATPSASSSLIVPARVIKHKSSINKNYQFETFVKGPNNQMAFAAAQAVVQKPGSLYNPLFIYGGSGLGKTHLLHAIANQLYILHSSRLEVLYQPADRFVAEFIHAIRFDKVHKFQAKYKNTDVLLIDDIQCISNKEQTQEAFFHIFNALYESHKQIIFSSDSYPANMNGLAERLRSRFAWGLVTDIQMPTYETKIAILKQKSEGYKQLLHDEVAQYIACQQYANVRELEGALVRVLAYANLMKQQITIQTAQKALENQSAASKNNAAIKTIDSDEVATVVSKSFACSLTDMRSKSKSRDISLARQVTMFLLKKFTQKSLHEIAFFLKRQDHTTILYGCRQIEQRIKNNQEFASQIKKLEQQLSL